MANQRTKRILSTAGVAASVVGLCGMAAPQASAAGGPGSSAVGQNAPMVAGLPLAQVMEQVPVLKGNGSNNH